MKTEAQRIKCGDVFLFRGQLYVTLMNYRGGTERLVSIITAIPNGDYGKAYHNVMGFRFYKSFELEVVNRKNLQLFTFENTHDELRGCRKLKRK